MNDNETIAAICTGVGGTVSVIRISGTKALEIAGKVWKGQSALNAENARRMLLGKTLVLADGSGEPAVAVYMPAPRSYTGEDVVEIHCHGGTLITGKVFGALLSAGAKPAAPGEFTYRAFINGKMDLTQAEAVSDIISAHSEMALHLAERQISGRLGSTVREIREILTGILAETESRIDFPEEDLEWTAAAEFAGRLESCSEKMRKLLESRREGAVLRSGVRVVIAGRPNVGKSSLLNLLLGYERAIVTEIPGTTRDTLEEFVTLRNIPVKLIDTAGIREADNIIENYGIDRSRETIKMAQVVFWMMDASADTAEELSEMEKHTCGRNNIIAVWNKSDLAQNEKMPGTSFPSARISVKENSGTEELLDLLEKAVWGYPHTEEPEIAVSSRHAKLLEEALEGIAPAAEKLASGDWELAAVHLRQSVVALGSIIGENADPDILENIFSRFCIGK